MKCNFDYKAIHDYNNKSLSIEAREKVEQHLAGCLACRRLMNNDRIFLNVVKSETYKGAIPLDGILSRVDASRYSSHSYGYRIKGLIHKLIPQLRYLVSALALAVIIALILANPSLFDGINNSAQKLIKAGDRSISNVGSVRQITLEKLDMGDRLMSDAELEADLNIEGMGVAPWEVVFADNTRILFRNYASLVCYQDGHIYRAADLTVLDANHVQGSIVTQFSFNSSGEYVVIGNALYEIDIMDDYASGIYMLNTVTGRYFEIGRGNMGGIADSWSFNGRYYAFTSKNKLSDVWLFDSVEQKMYQFDSPEVNASKVFVSDNGNISLYSEGSFCLTHKEKGKWDRYTADGLEPIYIYTDSGTALFHSEGKLVKAQLQNGKIDFSPGSDGENQAEIASDIYMKNNRFIVFKYSQNKLGVIDLADESSKVLESDKLSMLDMPGAVRISPGGRSIMFGDGPIYYVYEGGEASLDTSALVWHFARWLDDESVVSVDMMPIEKPGQSQTRSQAGMLQITVYNIKTHQQKNLYESHRGAQSLKDNISKDIADSNEVEEDIYNLFNNFDNDASTWEKLIDTLPAIDWRKYNKVSDGKAIELLQWLKSKVTEDEAEIQNILNATKNLDGAYAEMYSTIVGKLYIEYRQVFIKCLGSLDDEQLKQIAEYVAYDCKALEPLDLYEELKQINKSPEISKEEKRALEGLIKAFGLVYGVK